MRLPICSRECAPKVIYRLVHELADDGIHVAVACRVLEIPRSSYS